MRIIFTVFSIIEYSGTPTNEASSDWENVFVTTGVHC